MKSIVDNELNRNKMIKHIIMLLVILVVYIGFCIFASGKTINCEQYINKEDLGGVIGELKNGDVITQRMEEITDTICSIGFKSATYGNENAGDGQLIIGLYNEIGNELLGQVSYDMSNIHDYSIFKCDFDKEIILKQSTNIIVKIEISGMKDDDKYTVYLGNNSENEYMNLNGNPTNGTLQVILYKKAYDGFTKATIFALIVLGLFIILMYYLIFIRENTKIEILYLVCAIVLGGLFLVYLPEYGTPDEARHIQTAYSVSNMILGYEYEDDIEFRDIDYDTDFLVNRYYRDKYNAYVRQLIKGYNVDSKDTVMIGYKPLNAPRYLYFISGIGITIGRVLSFGTVPTYLLGTILNYAFFVILVYYAIKKIPIGKVAVLLIAIFPMTLQQATSYSYDCGTIALGLLLVSLVLNISYSDSIKKIDVIVLLITMFLFVPTKGCAYFTLAFLVLIPIIKYWKVNKRISRVLMIGLIVSCCFVVLPSVINVLTASGSSETTERIIGWANAPGYTLSQLLSEPVNCFKIVYDTILTNTSFYIHTMIGGYLGWLEISVPWSITLLLCITLIISIMKVENENIDFTPAIKALFAIICIISVCCIMAALLLDWTPASYTVIQGVQGRYFLPILLLVVFLLRGNWIVIKKNVPKYCVFVVALIQPVIIYSFILYMR